MTIDKKKTLPLRNGIDEFQLTTLFPSVPSYRSVTITEDHITSLIMARRGRDAIFGKDLFSDPAWDILLELYGAYLAHRETFMSELASSIGAPPSTMTRWVSTLQTHGFVTCDEISESGRVRIGLTTEGSTRMKRLIDQWRSAFVTI